MIHLALTLTKLSYL